MSSLTYNLSRFPAKPSVRSITALSFRGQRLQRRELFLKYLGNYKGEDKVVLSMCERAASDLDDFGQDSWRQYLPIYAKAYEIGTGIERRQIGLFDSAQRGRQLSALTAREIASNSARYPGYLAGLAEAACRTRATSDIIPVGKVASKERWLKPKGNKRAIKTKSK